MLGGMLKTKPNALPRPVILFTSGCYSDYSVLAIVNWLRDDVTPQQARDIYLGDEHKDPEGFGGISGYKFVGWLNLNGYTEDIEALEISVEQYGRIGEWKVSDGPKSTYEPED